MIKGHGQDSRPTAGQGNRKSRTARRPRTLVRLSITAALICVVFFSGFAAFLWSLDRREGDPPRTADAIVALTGGQGRIEDALELLDKRYGGRLLITGVNEKTSREAIKRLTPALRGLVECCVDLDYRARNTAGNAAEIRRWAEANGFRSLIVVTSNYHLPRTLAELDDAIPGVAKIPHAVIGRSDDDWQAGLARSRIMLSEYVKFLAVSVRTRVAGLVHAGRQTATTRSPIPVPERPRAG